MTSPFRFDGTGEPETEEERRKRQLREAMRAAQLGLPLASQLPAMTITAPRSSMLDASARRTADITSAFESALNYEKRQREALQAAEAGIPLASRTQAPLPPIVITPENRYQAHPWTLAMNRAQMNQEEAAKLPELPKQLTMGDIGRDIALQPLAASAGMVTRFGEGAARTVGAESIAESLRQRRELINEIAAPQTGVGRATRVGSELVTGALPYVAAGAGLPGLIRSAGMTALESRVGAEGSLFGTLGELTQQEQLQRLAASPYRTAADVAADVGFNVLPGAVRGAVRGARQARQVVQAAPAGIMPAARALGREAVTAGREAVQGAGRQLRQMAEQQPGTLLASAAALAGEGAIPGAGLLATALPATLRSADMGIARGVPSIPQEVRSVGRFGFVRLPETYTPNLALETEHVANVLARTEPILSRFGARTQEAVNGAGLFGGDVSPNSILRFAENAPDEELRTAAAMRGIAFGQDQQLWYRKARPDEANTTAAFVLTGRDFSELPDNVIDAVVTRLRADDALGPYGGATRDGNHLLALNLKRYTGMDDAQFRQAVTRAVDEVAQGYDIAIHPSAYYAEHLDGTPDYVRAIGRRPDALRAARDAIVDAEPEYLRYAQAAGADVDVARREIANRVESLDRLLQQVEQPPPLGRTQDTVPVAQAARQVYSMFPRLRAQRDEVVVPEMVTRLSTMVDDLVNQGVIPREMAQDFYRGATLDQRQIARLALPELREDPKYTLYTVVNSILSSGQQVPVETRQGLNVFDQYLRTGRFSILNPEDVQYKQAVTGGKKGFTGERGTGLLGEAMAASPRTLNHEQALARLDALVQAFGEEGAVEALVEGVPIMAGRTVKEERPALVYLFGPKIGQYAMDKLGIPGGGKSTIDLWMARLDYALRGDSGAIQGNKLNDTVLPTMRRRMQGVLAEFAKQNNMPESSAQALAWYAIKNAFRNAGGREKRLAYATLGSATTEAMMTPITREFGAEPLTQGLTRRGAYEQAAEGWNDPRLREFARRTGREGTIAPASGAFAGKVFDITGAVPEALRQTFASPAASAATGAIAGALADEEDRFRGAVVGGVAGAGVGAGVRGTKALLRNRAALKASGLSPDLADAYTIAKGGIDFTGAEAQKIAKAQRGSWREVFKRGVDNFADAQRELDRLAGRAEALGMAPEASVGTALDIALSSDVTAARAIRSGMGVERGGIIDPITREFMGEPLEDVFKPLGGVAAKNEQALTYAVALRNIGRYDTASAKARQWDMLAADAAKQAEGNLLNVEQAAGEAQAIDAFAQQARRADVLGQVDVPRPSAARPAVGVDDPALAERLQAEGARRATEALGPRPNPLQVYGGNAEREAADRQIVEAFSQKPEFQEFATQMEQYFNNLSEYAVRSGLWTPQQAQAIRESDTFYVPFKRLIEAYTGGGAGPMRGGITPGRVGPGVKRFTGSDLMVGNPAETIASYTAALIRRADMYRVGSTLIDTVEQLGPEAASLLTKIDAGDPMARALGVADAEAAYRQLGLPEEEAKQVADLFVRMDDKNPVITRNTPAGKEYYLVNDPAVYNALMTLNPQDGQAAKAIVAIFGPLKRLGTAFATGYSPQFWFGTNIPRDLVVGLAQNPNITVGDIAVGIKEAAKSVVGRSEMVEQLSRAGMGQVSQYGGPPSPEALARQIAPTSTGQAVVAEATSALGAPLRGLERVGRATELPMRLAAARAAQRTAAEAGVSPRGQMALASRRGATATVDFRRRAGNAFERLLENTVMYYGAAKKGGVWFARAAKNNPERMGAAAGVITLGTVLEYMMSRGEERKEFVDRPASERARYLHVGPARVALPQEFAALAAGVRVGLAQLEQDDPFVFEQFKQSLLNMLPPIYTDVAKGDIAAAVTPFPVARQAVELSRNRSAFGDRPIVSQSMERRLPEARRYETTAPTYDVLARGARAIGLEEASPIQAEFAARGIFGRFAPAVTALTDIAAAPMAGQQAAERVPLPMSRQPLNPVTGFTARPVTRGQSEQEFYNIRTEVQQAKATISALKKVRDEAKKAKDTQALAENEAQVKRLVAENPVFAAVYNDRKDKQIDKVFSELEDKLDEADAKRQAITAQFRNKKITGQRARQLLDENDQKRAELFRRGYQRLITRVPQ